MRNYCQKIEIGMIFREKDLEKSRESDKKKNGKNGFVITIKLCKMMLWIFTRSQRRHNKKRDDGC